MIIHGEYDFRIPYTESLQAFTAARLNNVEARLLIFPEETHFVVRPQNAVLWQREFLLGLTNTLSKLKGTRRKLKVETEHAPSLQKVEN